MNKRGTYSGGSIVSFIVVGVVLAVVLAGGIYFLTQRSEQARRDAAIAQVEQNEQEEGANDEVTMPGGSSDDETENEDEPNPYPAGDEGSDAPNNEEGAAESEANGSTDTEATDTSDDDSLIATGGSDGGDHTTLPETGPAETVATMAVFAALSFAGVAFARSQRQRSLNFDL